MAQTQLLQVQKHSKRPTKPLAVVAPEPATNDGKSVFVHQFFYSIPDLLEIPTQALHDLAAACGVDTKWLPGLKVREASAFKRAVESLHSKSFAVVGEGDKQFPVCKTVFVRAVPGHPRLRQVVKETRRGATVEEKEKAAQAKAEERRKAKAMAKAKAMGRSVGKASNAPQIPDVPVEHLAHTRPDHVVLGSIEYLAPEKEEKKGRVRLFLKGYTPPPPPEPKSKVGALVFKTSAKDILEIQDFMAMEQKVRDRFHHCLTHYSDRDLRNIMTRALRGLRAVTFRGSGGVFVCPVRSAKKLESLVNFLDGLEEIRHRTRSTINAPTQGADEKEVEIFAVPLRNEPAIVARVGKRLVSLIVKDCDNLAAKVRAWAATKEKVPNGRIRELQKQLASIQQLHDTYDVFLNANIGQATQRLQRVTQDVNKLIRKVG